MTNKVEICGVNTSKLPILSRDQKKKLFEQIKQGNAAARDEFVQGNLRLVLSVLKRFSGRGENIDDLFQVGCVGLIKAIDNFDTSQNVQFSTYAVPMNVPCRNEVYMRPRKWTETAIKQAFDDFIRQYDRLPTKQEMYEKYNGKFPRPISVKLTLGITLDKYLQLNYTTHYKRKQARIYGVMPDEYWIEDFKRQYIEYNYPVECIYNKLRKPQTPNTETLAKIIGVTTWCEVLAYCGFEEEKTVLHGELIFEETLENYQKLNTKLQKILKDLE